MRVTRRGIQVGLGLLWLLDGALQLQPFMFTSKFAEQVMLPAGQGQPGWVSGPVTFFAGQLAQRPALLDTAFALVQMGLGVALLIPFLVRPAIIGSLCWAAGIWWLGEGLGGLASGQTSLVNDAPGAVFLYAVLAVAVWPMRRSPQGQSRSDTPVAGWLPVAWAVLWVGGAILQVLPAQRGGEALRHQLGETDGVPGWLGSAHRGVDGVLSHGGTGWYVGLVAVMAIVGVVVLLPGVWRMAAATVGGLLGILIWVFGQNLGELYSGQSTDPNTGPLLVLMAVAILGAAPVRRSRDSRDDRDTSVDVPDHRLGSSVAVTAGR
ncbi:MAG: hypothetical protein ACR2KG_02295 [Nocardioidaceae bacterium]